MISWWSQQQNCLSDVYLVVLQFFRNDICIYPNHTNNRCFIIGRCQSVGIYNAMQHLCSLLMALCLGFEGWYGIRTARLKFSFYADVLMSVTKYVVALFELSLCGLIMLEKWKLDKVREGFGEGREVMKQTSYAFFLYSGMCVFPQMTYWTFFLYIIYQYSLYTRSIPSARNKYRSSGSLSIYISQGDFERSTKSFVRTRAESGIRN